MTERDLDADPGLWTRLRSAFRRLHAYLHRNPITGMVTKVVVTILGVAVIGAGLVMMVTPGPGIVGIIVGLGILATEWHWAERWMHSMKTKARAAADRALDVDPAVRRRRYIMVTLGIAVIIGATIGLVHAYGWPDLAVTAWDKVQSFSDRIPELPGM